jgi:hypothetical protein
MSMHRRIIWGSAVVVIALLLLLDLADVYPSWVVIGPVCLGVAGVALLADQIVCSSARKGGFVAALLMIALSAGTVTQDAKLVVDEWAVWPFVAAAIALGIPLEAYAAHRRRKGRARDTHPRHIGASA